MSESMNDQLEFFSKVGGDTCTIQVHVSTGGG